VCEGVGWVPFKIHLRFDHGDRVSGQNSKDNHGTARRALFPKINVLHPRTASNVQHCAIPSTAHTLWRAAVGDKRADADVPVHGESLQGLFARLIGMQPNRKALAESLEPADPCLTWWPP
jgi:hypothetical protein